MSDRRGVICEISWLCLSADMKDDMDIMRQCSQLYAQGNALARRFHNVLGQCESNYFSLLLFFVVPPIHPNCGGNTRLKLYVAYNNAFRMLFMLPRDCSAIIEPNVCCT